MQAALLERRRRDVAEVAEVAAQRAEDFERYELWYGKRITERDSLLLTIDSLRYDLSEAAAIHPTTWEQFDADERTLTAEAIETRHATHATYTFNGEEVVVTEATALRPELTLGRIHQAGYEKSKREADADSAYNFQLRRDEIFLDLHRDIISMMKGDIKEDTLEAYSVMPVEGLATQESRDILKSKYYNAERMLGFKYVFRRLPDNRLECITISLDNCTPTNVAESLRDEGFRDVPFEMLRSDEYGSFVVRRNTGHLSAEQLEDDSVSRFDRARMKVQGVEASHYGRDEVSYDAHDFLSDHEEYWAVYKSYNEQLARALNGEPAAAELLDFISRCIIAYDDAGKSILGPDETLKVKYDIQNGTLTSSNAVAFKKVLFHTNISLFKKLFDDYKMTGETCPLATASASDMLDSYSQSAATSGGSMAARGEGFGACGTGASISENAVNSLAQQMNISQDEARRRLEANSEDASRCIECTQNVPHTHLCVTCPLPGCGKETRAFYTAATITCMDGCGRTLHKNNGKISGGTSGQDESKVESLSDWIDGKMRAARLERERSRALARARRYGRAATEAA